MSEVGTSGNAKESALHEESGDMKQSDVHRDIQDKTNGPSEDVPSADLTVCTAEANIESSKMGVSSTRTDPDVSSEAATKGSCEAVDEESSQDTEEKKVVHSQEETSKISFEQRSDLSEAQERNGLSPESSEERVRMQKLDGLPPSSVDLVAHSANIDLSEEINNESTTEPVTDSVKDKTVPVPALCSSTQSPSDSCKEVTPSDLSLPEVCEPVVAASKDEKPVLDFTNETEAASGSVCNSEEESSVENQEASGETSVVGQFASGADQEDGHEAAADSCESPVNPDSDQESCEGHELHLNVSKGDLDEDSGVNEGMRGLEDDELEDDLDEDEEYCLKGERQQGDGQESADPSDLQDKVLDFDEDKRNPQYIPKKGAFYQHDDRLVGDGDESEIQEEKNEDEKGARRQKKLWHDEGVWGHDMYREEEQAPKTSEELVNIYGYDIRTETMPPRARRRRRYGRGPNKYQRNWEDEEAYTPRSGSGRGGGMRGGRRPRGGGQVGNLPFRDEDFPDLNVKRSESESSATAQQDKAEVKEPIKPSAFKNSDLGTPDNGPQQGEWEHVAKNSGTARRGWGKRPSQPPRRLPDASPKQQDDEIKENVSLGHRAGKSALQSPVKTTTEPFHTPSYVGKSRAVRHVLTEQERSRRNAEMHEKTVLKAEPQDGGVPDLTRSSAAAVAPRGGPVGGSEVAGKPRRYSSLRQRPLTEAAPYTEAAVVAAQLPNAQAPPPGATQPQPAILTAAHFQGPYAPYPDDYMLPPAQAPAVMPPPSQPPPVMAPAAQMSSPFLPPPGGILSFPPQYPPPYTFPAQYAAPAPAAPPPTQTQAQKPPYYHGDIIYYNTQSQQHKQRPTPPRRPKAAIPIVPPPESHGTVQESTSEADGSASHQSKSDEDPDDSGVVIVEPALQEGLAAQQAVEGL